MSTGYSHTMFYNHKERESLNVRHLGFGLKRCHFGNKMKHEAMENDRIFLSLICCWRGMHNGMAILEDSLAISYKDHALH